MGEKHLTELPWKTLAVKQGVKDLGLGKALAAYSNLDAAQQPAKALEGLQQITELAVKLKKANLKKEEVVAHLDEVVKEVKKTMPSLEARVKSSSSAASAPAPVAAKGATAVPAKSAGAAQPVEDGAEDDEKEAAAIKKDLKQQLVGALAQVKARAPGDPELQKEPKPQLQFMTCLAGTNCAVIVARKVGSATKKLLLEIAGVAGGAKFIQGECLFEKNSHTFVLAEVPSGLAQKLAKALHTETGQKFKVRVRNTDGSVSLDSDTDLDPEAAAATPPSPNSAAELEAQWRSLKLALYPGIKKALEVKSANRDKIAALVGEASKQEKARSFRAALDAFTQVRPLLEATAAAPAPEPEPVGADALATWQRARAFAVTQLRSLGAAIKVAKDPEADRALIVLEAVAKNLTESPATLRTVQELEHYIQTDDVVAEAELPNPFGLTINLRAPLLAALAPLKSQLARGV